MNIKGGCWCMLITGWSSHGITSFSQAPVPEVTSSTAWRHQLIDADWLGYYRKNLQHECLSAWSYPEAYSRLPEPWIRQSVTGAFLLRDLKKKLGLLRFEVAAMLLATMSTTPMQSTDMFCRFRILRALLPHELLCIHHYYSAVSSEHRPINYFV